jgi:thioredoxin 1
VPGTITTLTDATFDEEIAAASGPVLVDFWAEWCGPCRIVAPVLEEIASENPDRLHVAKVNVDDSVELARRFEVMSIPTLILFSEGQPKLRLVGAKPKGQLLEELEAFL